MFLVIAYDVVCDKRRNRLAKLLLGYGERVNYSVFECDLRPPQFAGLHKQILQLIDLKEDRVRYYELCLDCRRRILVNGAPAPVSVEPLVFV
mgnify:CR=1 FL=1